MDRSQGGAAVARTKLCDWTGLTFDVSEPIKAPLPGAGRGQAAVLPAFMGASTVPSRAPELSSTPIPSSGNMWQAPTPTSVAPAPRAAAGHATSSFSKPWPSDRWPSTGAGQTANQVSIDSSATNYLGGFVRHAADDTTAAGASGVGLSQPAWGHVANVPRAPELVPEVDAAAMTPTTVTFRSEPVKQGTGSCRKWLDAGLQQLQRTYG